jgi:hypothetical protein
LYPGPAAPAKEALPRVILIDSTGVFSKKSPDNRAAAQERSIFGE